MAKMVSMERSKGKTGHCDCLSGCGCGHDGPKYPYGLSIYLEDESLKALGIDKIPATGTEMNMTIKVRVTSSSEEEMESGEVEKRVGMQITDIAMPGKEKGMFDHPSRVKEEE